MNASSVCDAAPRRPLVSGAMWGTVTQVPCANAARAFCTSPSASPVRADSIAACACSISLVGGSSLHAIARDRSVASAKRAQRADDMRSSIRAGCSTMKDLSLDDRPREKLVRNGVSSLGDNELIALVIGNGSRRRNALAVANALLAARGGLHGLTRSTCDDLLVVMGIGRARAAQIVAALELGRRTLTHGPSARVQIRCPSDAAAYLMPQFGSRSVEQFGVVLLDSKHRVMRTTVLAIGTLNSTVVQPREVFREAAVGGAAAIVAFHNSPPP